jgi:hypothetical protein
LCFIVGMNLRTDFCTLIGDKSVVSIAQTLMKNAAKSFKDFKYLQRAMAIEETEEKKTCLDMPYRHLTKLSTRTNMIHMNIGDNGMLNLLNCNILTSLPL